MKVNSMKSCAWKEFHGLNEKTFNFKTFKEVLMVNMTSKFNTDSGRNGQKVTANRAFTGAILFSGATNGKKVTGISAYATEIRKRENLLKRIEEVKCFIEAEGMGDILEIPEFTNSNHDTRIHSFMLMIEPKGMKKALNRWLKEGVLPKPDNDNTQAWQV